MLDGYFLRVLFYLRLLDIPNLIWFSIPQIYIQFSLVFNRLRMFVALLDTWIFLGSYVFFGFTFNF
ncbi:hypothetical protein LINGRAHAP2_LOCUS27832 [Linum grandiflorum]